MSGVSILKKFFKIFFIFDEVLNDQSCLGLPETKG